MPEEIQFAFGGLLLGLLLGVLAAAIFISSNAKFNREITEHECGHYDPRTGEFQWGK